MTTISVTKQDLSAGTRCDGKHCAIALAIGRAVGRPVIVASLTVRPARQMHGAIDLPHAAREFIRRYDAGEVVQPFEFSLSVPAAWISSSRRQGVSAGAFADAPAQE